MNDPHDGELEKPGQVTFSLSPSRQAIKCEVHYVSIHLSAAETLDIISRLMKLGKILYGDDWGLHVAAHLGLEPMKEDIGFHE